MPFYGPSWISYWKGQGFFGNIDPGSVKSRTLLWSQFWGYA